MPEDRSLHPDQASVAGVQRAAAAVWVVPERPPTATLRRLMLTALMGASRDVVVDLRSVDGLSALDIGALVGVNARQRARGRRFTLVLTPRSAPDQALSRTGLRGSFSTTEAVPSAAPLPTR